MDIVSIAIDFVLAHKMWFAVAVPFVIGFVVVKNLG